MSRARKLIDQSEGIIYKSPDEIAHQNLAISLTGNAPRGGAISREFAITPTGSEFFADEAAAICAAYDALPVCDPSAVDLWKRLGDLCLHQAEMLRTQFKIIRYDDIDPYTTSDQMLADISKGTYKVTSLYSVHPVWDVDTNVAFRIAHDLLGHGATHAEFSFAGEVLAYQGQTAVTPEELWPVLFTEIVGQVAAHSIHHFFGRQRVGLIMLSQEEINRHVQKALSPHV